MLGHNFVGPVDSVGPIPRGGIFPRVRIFHVGDLIVKESTVLILFNFLLLWERSGLTSTFRL